MSEITKVALDAMGGDNAPTEIVKGAVDALQREKSLYIFLVGQEDAVKKELEQYTYDPERMEIVPASEVIEMAEPPVNAIRKKKDSSIVVGMKLVKEGRADAFVSAGSTGAVLVGGQVIVGRIKGVERPPLAPLFPTENGVSLLIDCGANVDARPSHSGTVCKDGLHLYGTRSRDQGSQGRNCKYRCRRGKGKCTGKRDVPASEGGKEYSLYRKCRGQGHPAWEGRCDRL